MPTECRRLLPSWLELGAFACFAVSRNRYPAMWVWMQNAGSTWTTADVDGEGPGGWAFLWGDRFYEIDPDSWQTLYTLAHWLYSKWRVWRLRDYEDGSRVWNLEDAPFFWCEDRKDEHQEKTWWTYLSIEEQVHQDDNPWTERFIGETRAIKEHGIPFLPRACSIGGH